MTDKWVPKTTRPEIMGSKYMVSTGHYAATLAATRILDAGGNAVDAGVAGGLCLNVVQPDLTNLGGVAPICLYQAGTKRVVTISGLGTWPKDTDPEFFSKECGGRIPKGIHRSVVPAAIGSWLTALEQFGTKSLAEVAAPAIELAADGFPVHSVMHDTLSDPTALNDWRKWPSTAEIFLDPTGHPYPVGDLFVQSDLARTLNRLVEAERGTESREQGIAAARDRFYRGDIAQEMVKFSQRQGGWLSESDLDGFEVEVEEAVSVNYHGYDVYACGPWSSGPVVLETLNILEGYELGKIEFGSADYYHLIVEALKAAFADRDRYFGDPRFVQVPMDGLLSKDYAAQWRKRIDTDKASPGMPIPGDPWEFSADTEQVPSQWQFPAASDGVKEPDTSHLCVVDAEGNAFSATPSDGVTGTPIVDGLGFIISGRGFQSWLDPRHPSAVQPGKRPRLTPNPGIVIKDGEFVMPYGTPGLDVQPQAMIQFLVGMLDYGFNLQESIEAPRAVTFSFPSSSDPHPYTPGIVKLENRVSPEVAVELEERGHRVQMWPAWTGVAGSICAVRAEMTRNLYFGGADPRRVAYAMGW